MNKHQAETLLQTAVGSAKARFRDEQWETIDYPGQSQRGTLVGHTLALHTQRLPDLVSGLATATHTCTAVVIDGKPAQTTRSKRVFLAPTPPAS